VHCPQDIRLRRLAHRVLLVVGQSDHVLPLVSEEFVQIRAHVLHIVDATPELTPLAEVVDTNEQRFPATITCRVLERVSSRRAVAEVLCAGGWWWRCVMVSVCPLVAADGGHHTWSDCQLWCLSNHILLAYLVAALVVAVAVEVEVVHSCRIAVVAVPVHVSSSTQHVDAQRLVLHRDVQRTWLYPYCCGGGVGCP
jgi:uncharacterized membrane protein